MSRVAETFNKLKGSRITGNIPGCAVLSGGTRRRHRDNRITTDDNLPGRLMY